MYSDKEMSRLDDAAVTEAMRYPYGAARASGRCADKGAACMLKGVNDGRKKEL